MNRQAFGQLAIVFMLSFFAMNASPDQYKETRAQMVAVIEQQIIDTADATGINRLDSRVSQALSTVPRHKFVPQAYRHLAYRDGPLSIGRGQTISQPYIVALMTDLLNPQPGHTVLEIGTGSGYQAAVLSLLVKQVYSIEIIPELAADAASLLHELGYNNTSVMPGDGYKGWSEYAPFDGIIVTAGGDIPPLLIEQLKPGGRMIIPVGGQRQVQHLTLIEKDTDGNVSKEKLLPVRFVPLIDPEK